MTANPVEVAPHRYRKRRGERRCRVCGGYRWAAVHVRVPDHRQPPPYPYQGPRQGPGWCVFCGGRILEASGPELGPHERRYPQRCTWHNECVAVLQIARNSEAQRAALLRRDRGICSSCGVDTRAIKLERFQLAWINGRGRDVYPTRKAREALARGDLTGWYTAVRFSETWSFEADHVVPLWRAPREWRYWSLANLATACQACHRRKSAAEARERSARPLALPLAQDAIPG